MSSSWDFWHTVFLLTLQMWLRPFHFGQLARFTCPFCLFFVSSSGTLQREDKSSSVGEASSALLVVGSLCLMSTPVVSSVCLCSCAMCRVLMLQALREGQAGRSSAGHSWAAPELLKAWLYLPIQWLYPGMKRLEESLRGKSQLFCSQEIKFALCTLCLTPGLQGE